MIREKIIETINKEKHPISLETFIEMCLFEKNGYYNQSDILNKFGDFTTAPEISQLFGEILGVFIYYTWVKKYGVKFDLIELGPGNGTLLVDILTITKSFQNFHNNINVKLVENNKYFIKKQKQKLKSKNFFNIKANWFNDFEFVSKKPAIIFANEFFDCFPVRHFKKDSEIWNEKVINFDNKENRFFYEYIKIKNDNVINKKLKNITDQIYEISEQRDKYFKKICKYIKKVSGTMIIIDYGYLDFPGYFTLQALSNNKHSNLFDNIGKQDVTSLVNFKNLINIAENNDLNVENFTTQKLFLVNNGIIQRKENILKKIKDDKKNTINEDYNRITDEKNMGSLFKVLIISNKN
tara:strand:- start:2049 stop:3104 length:1056 start_codon:yes stop_codon:yes gene_type:complete